jgi:radical SAM superfamily enzyme YgiQ (UPF0313 family)
MYKDKKFRIKPLEDIKEDITSARMFYGDGVRTIFLADGNSIIMRTSQLVEILNLFHAMFPKLERVTSYGAAKFILKTKTMEELRELRHAGLSRIHMGLESGDGNILKLIDKGSTPEEMIKASLMVKEAGIELSQYVLLGLGGKDGWESHALKTASALNEMDPDFIRLRTLILRKEAPMYNDYLKGDFAVSSPSDILYETKMILENLEVDSHFLSDHVSNYANINGRLPADKDRMLSEIDGVISNLQDNPNLLGELMDPARCTRL